MGLVVDVGIYEDGQEAARGGVRAAAGGVADAPQRVHVRREVGKRQAAALVRAARWRRVRCMAFRYPSTQHVSCGAVDYMSLLLSVK